MNIQKLLRKISNTSNPQTGFFICVIIGSIAGTITFVTKNILLGIGIAVLFIGFLGILDYLTKRRRKQPEERNLQAASAEETQESFSDLIAPLNRPPVRLNKIQPLDFSKIDQILTDENFENLKAKHPDLAIGLDSIWDKQQQKIAFLARLTAKQILGGLTDGIDHINSWGNLEDLIKNINWELETAAQTYFPESGLNPKKKTGS